MKSMSDLDRALRKAMPDELLDMMLDSVVRNVQDTLSEGIEEYHPKVLFSGVPMEMVERGLTDDDFSLKSQKPGVFCFMARPGLDNDAVYRAVGEAIVKELEMFPLVVFITVEARMLVKKQPKPVTHEDVERYMQETSSMTPEEMAKSSQECVLIVGVTLDKRVAYAHVFFDRSVETKKLQYSWQRKIPWENAGEELRTNLNPYQVYNGVREGVQDVKHEDEDKRPRIVWKTCDMCRGEEGNDGD